MSCSAFGMEDELGGAGGTKWMKRIVHSTRANHHDVFQHSFMKSFLMNPVVEYISSSISLVIL